MRTRITHRLRRLAGVATGCLLGGALMVPMGPTTTSQAVNQINATSMRPMTASPSVTAPPSAIGVGDTMQWVPDRMVSVPGAGFVNIPGHWERRLDTHKVFVPALTGHNPRTGASSTFPAGTYPPVDERLFP
jgi:hypothetical protein